MGSAVKRVLVHVQTLSIIAGYRSRPDDQLSLDIVDCLIRVSRDQPHRDQVFTTMLC